MTDIYAGIAMMCALSIGLFVLSLRIGRKLPRREASASILLGIACLIFFATTMRDALWLARFLPFSNLVVLGQLQPLAMAVVAGLAWQRLPGNAVRKSIVLVPFTVLCLYQTYSPIFAPRPAVGEHWKNDVCRQTTLATCSPAAAATLLRSYGIATTESEMVSLCLTTNDGTSMLGLYRGLRLKTRGTPFRVKPFHSNLQQLIHGTALPVVLSVRLDRGTAVDARYESQWGWARGVTHTVVLFGFVSGDLVDIGDPAVGRENWSLDDLRVLWHGDGIALEKD